MSATSDQFWKLCLEADEAFQGVGDVRPALDRILEFVQSQPDARHELGQCFVELIRGRRPWEAAYYCMRHLKWPEVYEAATIDMQENADFRVKNVMAHIRDAYVDHPDNDYLY